jgi:hypothetical protein
MTTKSYAIFKKSNNLIVQSMSMEINRIFDVQQNLDQFCEDNGFNINDYELVELSIKLPKEVSHGKHIYDAATNSVIVDPTWIEPPRVETTSIPVSGT